MESSSSKVTVEYHDPSEVYHLIAKDIANRLPLRNLNWQTPSRPLRQIRSLHVDLVPDQATKSLRQANPSVPEPNSVLGGVETVKNGHHNAQDGTKERRHQIPGLKTSPYLRIYLLRCDDKEHYRERDRLRIREWIKSNIPGEAQSRQDHDASDWLILHVVLPGTTAASEPRWRDSSKDADDLKERPKSSAKWPGKSTRTVLDRLRADFNESSKTGPDRVAQIRLQRKDLPNTDTTPESTTAADVIETQQERENAWNDLIAKMKILILGPFDARVRQYEADIAKQESRRNVPGWNFCTFFIQKEGLAKALESIGLVEDALAIYDELSVGLETVVSDLTTAPESSTASMFADFTEEIENRLLHVDGPETASIPAGDCREMILRSTVSLFDFFSYIFMRQKTLMLRLAKPHRTQISPSNDHQKNVDGEDLVLLSNVCERARNFIHNNARALRQDLTVSSRTKQESSAEADDLINIWVYATAQYILEQTDAAALRDLEGSQNAKLEAGSSSNLSPFSGDVSNPYQSTDPIPHRTSSPQRHSKQNPLGTRVLMNPSVSRPNSRGRRLRAELPGQADLAANRIDLLQMQETALRSLAARRGWKLVSPARLLGEDHFSGDQNKNGDKSPHQSRSQQTVAPMLEASLQSEEAFHTAYEQLCSRVVRYCSNATENRSANKMIINLATLKWKQGEVELAAKHYRSVLPSSDLKQWNLVDVTTLAAYVSCLYKLNMFTEYVQAGLDLIYRSIIKRLHGQRKSTQGSHSDESVPVHGLFSRIITASEQLTNHHVREMRQFFNLKHLPQAVTHRENGLGFAALLHLEHVLHDNVIADEICMVLAPFDNLNQEVMLKTVDVSIAPGANVIHLQSSAIAHGAYYVKRLTVRFRKTQFIHDMDDRDKSSALQVVHETGRSGILVAPEHERPLLYLYPTNASPVVDIEMSRDIHIGKLRTIEVTLKNEESDLRSIALTLRPASAGLRLHLADSSASGFAVVASNNVLHLSSHTSDIVLKAKSTLRLQIPYKFETRQSGQYLAIHAEAECGTESGTVTLLKSAQIAADLPLDVDVDDIFQVDALISRFTVRTVNQMPLAVLAANLHKSSRFNVTSPSTLGTPMILLQDHPAKLVYKITQNRLADQTTPTADNALDLRIDYCSVAEITELVMTYQLVADLELGGLQNLTQFVLPLFLQRYRQIYNVHDVKRTAFTGEIAIKSYDAFAWHDLTLVLDESLRTAAQTWLRKWHETHVVLTIERAHYERATPRSITISVDVPSIDFVHDVSFELQDQDLVEPQGNGVELITVGVPVSARLRIKQSTAWNTANVHSHSTSRDSSNIDARFVFEVHPDPDIWLLGGPRRTHFDPIAADEVLDFNFTLIPLREGFHTLPTVEIQPVPVVDETITSIRDQNSQPRVTCETNLQSAGQMVQVARNIQQTRVHISEPLNSLVANPGEDVKR